MLVWGVKFTVFIGIWHELYRQRAIVTTTGPVWRGSGSGLFSAEWFLSLLPSLSAILPDPALGDKDVASPEKTSKSCAHPSQCVVGKGKKLLKV